MGSRDIAKQYAVNWNNHMNHVKKAFDNLLNTSELTDVTLYAEGQKIGAHKLLLSACSVYFQDLFREFPQEHPIVVLKGVTFSVLSDILKFIYHGEVSVDSSIFETFLQTAEYLQISGLTNGEKKSEEVFDNVLPEANENSIRRKKVKRSHPDIAYDDRMKKARQCHLKVNCNDMIDFDEDVSKLENSQFSPDLLLQIVKEEQPDPPDISPSKTDDPLQCPICFKIFSHPYSLHHHKPVHSGGTKCPICHAVLSRKYNLKMHMRSRHNVT